MILAKLQAQRDLATRIHVATRGVLRRPPVSPLGRACSVCSARPTFRSEHTLVSWRHSPYYGSTAVTSVCLQQRLSGCSGSTICARGNTGNPGNSDLVGSALRRVRVLDQRTEQTGKLRRHHQLGGRRRAERLERLQILEAHGLTVEVTRDRGDLR